MEQTDDYIAMDASQLDRHRAPRKGDFITFLDGQSNRWLKAQIISKSNYPKYFNIPHMDYMYLHVGQSWGEPNYWTIDMVLFGGIIFKYAILRRFFLGEKKLF